MRAFYGGVPLGDFSWARVRWGSELVRNAAGIGYGLQWTADFSELGFAVAGQFSADAAASIIAAALATPGGDLALVNDDGSPSFKSVLSASTFGGVRCVRGPAWSDAPGAQHLTHLKYAATFTWRTGLPAGVPLLMDYRESVTIDGGDPLTVVQEYLNAPPVAYETVFQQKYTAAQQGFAVGTVGYPPPNPPTWPKPNRRLVSRTSPGRVGDGGFEGYRVDWAYQWEFAVVPPGNLFPTPWLV